jgi:hypothetical protein
MSPRGPLLVWKFLLIALPLTVAKLANASWLIVIFGDSESLQHNSDERVEGEKRENPY